MTIMAMKKVTSLLSRLLLAKSFAFRRRYVLLLICMACIKEYFVVSQRIIWMIAYQEITIPFDN